MGCCVRMGNLFGKRKQTRVTEQDKAVLQLKQQRDKLRQYQKRINLRLEKERLLAKQLLKDGKRDKALLLLKKKRYQDQLLDKTENQIGNLERLVETKVIQGLKIGNECLKKMHEVMSVEEVERIMDETQDAIEYQRQIDDMLAGSFTQEDEDAVLAELEAITQSGMVPGRIRRERCSLRRSSSTTLLHPPTDTHTSAAEACDEVISLSQRLLLLHIVTRSPFVLAAPRPHRQPGPHHWRNADLNPKDL
ncbi:hypothetical protein F7725_014725 [Dissostichus mawsoni]|uniref:Charged multivesicular body protein 6 n=1 Tax=Dissostichus mawsoni TaxID=36200 RepID=A0A7J5YZS7_DISMA|nr:hypothetical protein F7725_014725 [Dissostichus mawsoni]